MKTSLQLALSNCLSDIKRGATLEDALSRYPDHRDKLEPLVCVALSVESLPKNVAPSPRFKAATKELIFREAARQPAVSGHWSVLPARAASLAAALLLSVTLAGAGSVYAALDSVPGDALYGFKVVTERARLALAFSDEERGALYITMAENRLEEITKVAQTNPQLLKSLAEEYERSVIQARIQAKRAADEELLRRIEEKVSSHTEVLQAVYLSVPRTAQPAIATALELSQQQGADKGPVSPPANSAVAPPLPSKDEPQPAASPSAEKLPTDPHSTVPSVPLPSNKGGEGGSSEPVKGLPGQPAGTSEASIGKDGTTPHTDQPVPITAKEQPTTSGGTDVPAESKATETATPSSGAETKAGTSSATPPGTSAR